MRDAQGHGVVIGTFTVDPAPRPPPSNQKIIPKPLPVGGGTTRPAASRQPFFS